MMLAWLVVLVLVVLVIARLATRQLPPASSQEARALSQQAERIEELEEELRRVKEQADFTEKLLTERSEARDEEKPESGGGS